MSDTTSGTSWRAVGFTAMPGLYYSAYLEDDGSIYKTEILGVLVMEEYEYDLRVKPQNGKVTGYRRTCFAEQYEEGSTDLDVAGGTGEASNFVGVYKVGAAPRDEDIQRVKMRLAKPGRTV